MNGSSGKLIFNCCDGQNKMKSLHWIFILVFVSLFGALQRPPILPINLTYLVFIVLAFLAPIEAVVRGISHFKVLRLDFMVFLFALSATISTFASGKAYGFSSLGNDLERLVSIQFFGLIGIYYACRFYIRQINDITKLIYVYVIGVGILSFWNVAWFLINPGDFDYHVGSEEIQLADRSFEEDLRLAGFGGNPNFFATYLILAMPLILYFLLFWKRTINQLLIFLILCITSLALVLTFSRSGLIATMISVFILALKIRKIKIRFKGVKRKNLFVKGVIIIGMGVAFAVFYKFDSLVIRLASLLDEQSLGSRPSFWEHGIKTFIEFPFGVGGGNQLFASFAIPTNDFFVIGRDVHNAILKVFIEYGFLGGIIFLIMAGIVTKPLICRLNTSEFNNYKALMLVLSCSILGLLLHCMFHSYFRVIQFWVLLACYASLQEMSQKEGKLLKIIGSASNVRKCLNDDRLIINKESD